MRRFDWYYFSVCLFNVLAAFFGVTTLFVMIDFFVNLDRFTGEEISVDQLLVYYLYSTPPVLYQLAPLVVLLGGMFAAARLLRASEVLPLQVGGLRASRAFRGFWLVATLAAISMFAAQEYLLPRLEQRFFTVAEADIKGGTGKNLALNDSGRNVWYIREYNVLGATPWIADTMIFRLDKDGRLSGRVYAPRLEYREGAWRGDYVTLDATSESGSIDRPSVAAPLPHGLNLSPGEISREGTRGAVQPVSALAHALTDAPYRYDLAIKLYVAIAYPLSCISLLMIGITLALRLNARNLFVAGTMTLGVAFAAYSASFLLEGLAQRGALSPEAAVFGPAVVLFILGGLGLRTQADGAW
ncbi:MAG: LptF/LptG family permease [Planctomycetes bacterium]|nr:LptF/LptG family permease [Planctomycetota bacterium]NUQ35254.1 YjgP/YjgQ family permease [Planctomycetaceae bacterium]